MRLLGGSARGMNLATVKGPATRPALARVRNSLFNILAPRLEGARALDLFAGTGSLGLEALSRGAVHAVFVDGDPRCCEAIRESLGKMDMTERGVIVRGDAFRWGSGNGPAAFDVVFVAPPYAFYKAPATAPRMIDLAEGLLRHALAPEGLLICEHRLREGLAREPAGGRLADRREYGQTVLSIYSRASP